MKYKIVEIDEDDLMMFDETIIQVLKSEQVFKDLSYMTSFMTNQKLIWKLTCLVEVKENKDE